ncbi:hypothetical protein DPMN_143772 [Dreissena polymorpha]|uniref:Uncharacterized protein n=1 Tax=Dreissena polymorpha TaxID=45954 RepID=A0A9D4GHN9_DREPO|nr:hypothetical protein DPMN_143772 [Dreissena polymorpha]
MGTEGDSDDGSNRKDPDVKLDSDFEGDEDDEIDDVDENISNDEDGAADDDDDSEDVNDLQGIDTSVNRLGMKRVTHRQRVNLLEGCVIDGARNQYVGPGAVQIWGSGVTSNIR